MTTVITWLLFALFSSTGVLYLLWIGEKSKRKYLEQLLFRINQKIDLLEKAKPTHYVPSRHHGTSVQMGEKSSSYQECVDYEQLQIAVREGGYASKK